MTVQAADMTVQAHPVPARGGGAVCGQSAFVERMRGIALRSLGRMYRRELRRFVFRLRRGRDGGIAAEGLSTRYTAITVIGLARERQARRAAAAGAGSADPGGEDAVSAALCGDSLEAVCDSLMGEAPRCGNLGDVALIHWAAHAVGHPVEPAARQRLMQLLDASATHPTVEAAWVLTAASQEQEPQDGGALRRRAEGLLLSAFDERSQLFRHQAGGAGSESTAAGRDARATGWGGLRGHVSCFADWVYPVQALAHAYRAGRSASAKRGQGGAERLLEIAERCAETMCKLIGPAGQWWWHYDVRTGRVLEGYPVYAVHQDAMAPMALLDLAAAGGTDRRRFIERGLAWLESSPELNGGLLVDDEADLIWRKVARRERGKLVRRLNAAASRLHSGLRTPFVDALFPPGPVDWETRPYHMGWLLYAFPMEGA